MVAAAVARPPSRRVPKHRVLEAHELSSVFGIDIDTGAGAGAAPKSPRPGRRKKAGKVEKRARPRG
jgi:hypothetical protein